MLRGRYLSGIVSGTRHSKLGYGFYPISLALLPIRLASSNGPEESSSSFGNSATGRGCDLSTADFCSTRAPHAPCRIDRNNETREISLSRSNSLASLKERWTDEHDGLTLGRDPSNFVRSFLLLMRCQPSSDAIRSHSLVQTGVNSYLIFSLN